MFDTGSQFLVMLVMVMLVVVVVLLYGITLYGIAFYCIVLYLNVSDWRIVLYGIVFSQEID